MQQDISTEGSLKSDPAIREKFLYIIAESTFHDRYYIWWSDLMYLKQQKNKSAIKLTLFDIKKYLSNYVY